MLILAYCTIKGPKGERSMKEQLQSGRKATFVVEVQFQQNNTLQGTIRWLEEKRSQRFRSTLELMKLMDDALKRSNEKSMPSEELEWEPVPSDMPL